jgi:sigma-B regulation protein RsbU (phosphoserine phosphatase)
MSNVQAAVKSIAAADLPPSELCVQINRLVCGNVDPGKLITFCYALVDLQRRQVTYANAGHNAPILVRRNGESVRLTAGGLVFGFSAASTYEQGRLELLPGDRLILYTDGLSEARNAQGIEFGEDRLRDLISANRALGAVELQQQLLTAIGLFAGDRLQDDATMVVLALE